MGIVNKIWALNKLVHDQQFYTMNKSLSSFIIPIQLPQCILIDCPLFQWIEHDSISIDKMMICLWNTNIMWFDGNVSFDRYARIHQDSWWENCFIRAHEPAVKFFFIERNRWILVGVLMTKGVLMQRHCRNSLV